MKGLVISGLMCLLTFCGMSQVSESAGMAGRVIDLIATLQRVPVNVEMILKNSSNLRSGTEDTSATRVIVQLRKNAAYVRFGELEQIINDSMAVMVNDSIQQILMIRSSPDEIRDQWFGLLGTTDESAASGIIDSLYLVSESKAGFSLESRAKINGVTIPRETIDLVRDPKEERPSRLLITQRSIVLLDSADAAALRTQGFPAEKIIKTGEVFYVVKEKYTQVSYDRVSTENGPLPYFLQDRVVKDAGGRWKPAKAYASYQLLNQTNR